jgi:TonB-linked SusC/RagA family outer membrane protein
MAASALRFKPALIISITLLTGICMSVSVYAQTPAKVQGTVTDEKGETIPGVSVLVKGTTSGTQTDIQGHYNITVNTGQTLVFSAIGYKSVEEVVSTNTSINVKLATSTSSLNEVVVVGYTSQKKVALTGAVSSINNAEIVTTKNENILNTLTGKIPGLRIVQNTSEPGAFNNSYDIRGLGTPLIVIDGIPRTDIARVDPNDVESISVLKDASAAVYGVRAANGVILITTKKGKSGTMDLNYTGTYGLQVPSRFSHSSNATEYMTLFNESRLHNVAANAPIKGTPLYTPADFAAYENGTKTSTDWNAATVNKSAGQTQHNLSASGGTDKATYYISLGFTGQDGILKSNDLDYKKYNLRSNLSTKISNNLTFDLNLSGTMDIKNQPYQAPYWIFRSMWYQPPVNPIYANNNEQYFNNVPNPLHPVAQADANTSGYQIYNNKWFQSAASLTYKVPFVDGLTLKGLYSFDFILNDNKLYQKAYNLYNYNGVTNTYNGAAQQSPSTIRREMFEYPTNLGQLQLNYNHSFGDHNLSGLLVYEWGTRSGDNFYGQRELSIPVDQLFAGNSLNQLTSMSTSLANAFKFKNDAYVGSFSYDYKSKYFGKFNFRYDGSSKFTPVKQYGFFPEGEIGWRLSEESFFKNTKALSFVNSFKIRGSYGLTGDDGSQAYQFLSGYTYPASGSATGQPPGSVFDGVFVNGVQSRGITNPNLTWFTAKTLDVGVDLEMWNGKLGITFDYFVRNREGLLATQLLTLSDVVGAGLPQQNLNSDRSKGFDFEISHRNMIGQFGYNMKAIFGFTRTMNVAQVAARTGNSYLNWIQKNGSNIATGANRNNNVYIGYGSNGQFENYAAIEHSGIYVSKNTVVGDYRYEDWNGDGQISVDDSHPIATSGLPIITYGFNLGAAYRGFDINGLFQGAAMVNATYMEQLREPLWAGGNALTQFLDRYHPVDPNADPYSPDTQWVPGYYAYTGTLPFINTLANTHSAAYVRLKSAELGYTLPRKWLTRSGIKNVRLFFTGYNLLTITTLKYLDPEHPSGLSVVDQQFGYAYPIDKIYSFGLNVKF